MLQFNPCISDPCRDLHCPPCDHLVPRGSDGVHPLQRDATLVFGVAAIGASINRRCWNRRQCVRAVRSNVACSRDLQSTCDFQTRRDYDAIQ
ncbi:hypothetical protein ANCCAN_26458, partial [Ancylostoma caninum]